MFVRVSREEKLSKVVVFVYELFSFIYNLIELVCFLVSVGDDNGVCLKVGGNFIWF